MKSGLTSGVSFLGGDNVVVHYYLSGAYEIWPDKWGFLSWGRQCVRYYLIGAYEIWPDKEE